MRKQVLGVLLFSMASATASATPWHTMGARAMGMGGAYTAIAQGPLASYWNPAGLGQLYNTSGVEIPVGARGEFAGTVLQGANDLNNLSGSCSSAVGAPAADCQARINEALSRLGQPGNGGLVDAGGGVSVKIKRAVVFVNNLFYVGITPQVDLARNTTATIASNQSKLVLRGGSFTELGVGYGQEILETGLIVGANLKGIVAEDPGSGDFTDFDQNTKTTFRPAVDLGLLWDMRETWPSLPMRPRAALVGRNLNNPKFDQPDAAKLAGDPDKYPIHSQARAGFALSPFKFWNLAADLDLTDNPAPVGGLRSRHLGLGTEINVFNRPWINIPLRAGIQKNVSAKADSALAYTGGFGLNFLHFMADVSGMVSAKTTTIQSEGESRKIPNNFGLSARVAFLFGGTDEGTRNK